MSLSGPTRWLGLSLLAWACAACSGEAGAGSEGHPGGDGGSDGGGDAGAAADLAADGAPVDAPEADADGNTRAGVRRRRHRARRRHRRGRELGWDLVPGHTYHYRLGAANAVGTAYGADATFVAQ